MTAAVSLIENLVLEEVVTKASLEHGLKSRLQMGNKFTSGASIKSRRYCVLEDRLSALQAALPVIWFLPSISWLLNKLFPGKGFAVIIPSTYLRFLTFKITADLRAVSQACRASGPGMP